VPTQKKNDLKERLARYCQIVISVIGRKSGNTISVPVWFVLEALLSSRFPPLFQVVIAKLNDPNQAHKYDEGWDSLGHAQKYTLII
jgi:hypothetical protein